MSATESLDQMIMERDRYLSESTNVSEQMLDMFRTTGLQNASYGSQNFKFYTDRDNGLRITAVENGVERNITGEEMKGRILSEKIARAPGYTGNVVIVEDTGKLYGRAAYNRETGTIGTEYLWDDSDGQGALPVPKQEVTAFLEQIGISESNVKSRAQYTDGNVILMRDVQEYAADERYGAEETEKDQPWNDMNEFFAFEEPEEAYTVQDENEAEVNIEESPVTEDQVQTSEEPNAHQELDEEEYMDLEMLMAEEGEVPETDEELRAAGVKFADEEHAVQDDLPTGEAQVKAESFAEPMTKPAVDTDSKALNYMNAVALENYRQAERNAQKDANSIIRYMDSTDRGKTIESPLYDQTFRATRDAAGQISYAYLSGTEWKEISKFELRTRITNELLQDKRKENGRDADAITYGKEGYLKGVVSRDPRTNREVITYRWADKDGNEKNVPEAEVKKIVDAYGWDDQYVKAHMAEQTRIAQERVNQDNLQREEEERERIREQEREQEKEQALERERDPERVAERERMRAVLAAETILLLNYQKTLTGAQKYANQSMTYLERNCEPGGKMATEVGRYTFEVEKNEKGVARYYIQNTGREASSLEAAEAGAGRMQRMELSRDTFIRILTEQHMQRARTDMRRDQDFALPTKEGVIIAQPITDKNGGQAVAFFLESSRYPLPVPLTRERANELMSGMSPKDIERNNRPYRTEAYKEYTIMRDAARNEMIYGPGSGRFLNEIHMSANHQMVKDIKTDKPKSALREALRLAKKNENRIDREVLGRTGGLLESMERDCPLGGTKEVAINGKKFQVTKSDSGIIGYNIDDGLNMEKVNREKMRKEIFHETKVQVVEEMKEKDIDELAIIPLNEKEMLIIRTADLETTEKNDFNDGNKDYNFYIRKEDGEEQQITTADANEIFKQNNIFTAQHVKERATRSLKAAGNVMHDMGGKALREAGQLGKRGLRYATLEQAAAGFHMDEMARL